MNGTRHPADHSLNKGFKVSRPTGYYSFQDCDPAGLLFPLQFAVDLAFAEAHFLGNAFHGLALVEFLLLHQVVDAGSGVLLFDGGLTLLLRLADEQGDFAANLRARLEFGEGLGGFEAQELFVEFGDLAGNDDVALGSKDVD